jgi:hypothetical protein
MTASAQGEAYYLQGQQHDRAGRCSDAARSYEQAVALLYPPAFAPLSMMLSGNTELTLSLKNQSTNYNFRFKVSAYNFDVGYRR